MSEWISNAKWTKLGFISTDEHNTKEEAKSVCRLLLQDYKHTPCSIRGYCLDTWVTKKPEPPKDNT